MNTEVNKINGTLTISDIVDNQWISQRYIGYTVKEAKRLFREYIKRLSKQSNRVKINIKRGKNG